MSALVTVMIPVYNAAEHIGTCLESLLKQTYTNIQIVVVDDGSTDRSFDICRSIADSDNRIKLIHQENGGEGAARNRGLKEADGEYLCFTDADDSVTCDFVETLVTQIEKERAQLSACGYDELRAGELLSATTGMPELLDRQTAMEYLLKEEFFRGYVWNKLFDLAIIRTHGLRFDPSLAVWTDVLFVFSYLKYCKKVVYDPMPKYHYNYMETSVSHSANHVLGVEKSFSAIRAQQLMAAMIPAGYNRVQSQLDLRYVQSALAVLRNIGYQSNKFHPFYQPSLEIVKHCSKKILLKLSRKDRCLVQFFRLAPELLLFLYKQKEKNSRKESV